MAEGSGAAVVEAATAVHEGWNLAGEGAAEAVAAIKADEADAKGEDGEAVSKAASELGRKGGKAAAEARAKAAKEAPEPAAKDAKAEPKAPAEPAEADDDAEDEGQDAKRSRARQRVEEATRKAAEERREREKVARERDELRAELERERRARQAPQPAEPQRQAQAEPPENDGPPEPKPEDFEDYNQYQQALIDHRVERKLQAVQQETEERQRQEKRAEAVVSKVRGFQSKIQEAGGADFLAEIAEEVRDLRPTIALQPGERPSGRNFLADAMLHQSEHAPALMRYLTENPREFQRIAELGSPYEIALSVGRLVGLFEAQSGGASAGNPPPPEQPVSKPASKAPPPVRPVTGAPSTAAGDYFREGEDFDSWNRRQRAAGR